MQLPISNSCRAGLVTLLEFLQLVLLLRVRLPFPLSVFLQLIFSFSLVLKPEQKLDAALPIKGVSLRIGQLGLRCFEDGAVLVCENGCFSWASFSSPGHGLVLTWTFTFSIFLSTPSPPSRPASQVLGGAFFLLPRRPSARALIWRQFVNEKPKDWNVVSWRLHKSGSLSGRLFLFPLATRRFHDPQLEPMLHVSLPFQDRFLLTLEVTCLKCATGLSVIWAFANGFC